MAFEKGQSGNPAGRKPGTTVGGKLRRAIEAKSDEILAVVVEAALSGDLTACNILLNKIIAPLKSVAPNVQLAHANSGDLASQGAEVIKSALVGEIPPDTANQLISAIAIQAKILETGELVKRIEALEQRNG